MSAGGDVARSRGDDLRLRLRVRQPGGRPGCALSGCVCDLNVLVRGWDCGVVVDAVVRFVGGELRVVVDGQTIGSSVVSGDRLGAAVDARALPGGVLLGGVLEEVTDGRFGEAWTGGSGMRLEVEAFEGSVEERRLMRGLPWEAVALDGVLLAVDPQRWWMPERVVSAIAQGRDPQNRAMRVLFMASSPEGSSVLSFEDEEQRIVTATSTAEGPLVDLVVEETGSVGWLGDRLTMLESEGVDVVHLTGHATVVVDGDDRVPVFVAEREEGGADPVGADRLAEVVDGRASLVFISGAAPLRSPMVRRRWRSGWWSGVVRLCLVGMCRCWIPMRPTRRLSCTGSWRVVRDAMVGGRCRLLWRRPDGHSRSRNAPRRPTPVMWRGRR